MSKAQKFRIKKISGVFFYNFSSLLEICAICHNHLNEPPIESCLHELNSRQSYVHFDPRDVFLIGYGQCGHKFHVTCVEKWLLVNRTCPLCIRDWFYDKLFTLPDIVF